MIVLTVLGILLLLLALRTPVAFALAASGAIGIVLLQGVGRAGATLAAIPFDVTARYSWVVIPLFILLGMLAAHANIAQDIYYAASRLLRWLPGGLGVSTVAACAGFAAISGSSLATAATIGRLSIREMVRHGYQASFAAGIVAASGTLGALIPPSLVLIVYAIIARESVAELLAAGIVPGLLTAASYGGYIVVRSLLTKSDLYKGNRAEDADPVTSAQRSNSESEARPISAPSTVRSASLAIFVIFIIFALVMGGISEGFFTVTESAALGALVCLVLAPVHLYLRGDQRGLAARLSAAAVESAGLSSMIFAIVIGASIFSFFLVLAGVPRAFAEFIISLEIPLILTVILLLLAMVPLGMFLEPLSILLIVIPLAHPVVTGLGFDGVWFGILAVKMVEVGMITPPVGLNVFVVAGTSEDVTVEDGFRGVTGFLLMDAVTIAAMIAFPEIVLWLPNALLR